jgi:hypothetical protein
LFHDDEEETGREDDGRRNSVAGSVESSGIIEFKLLL